MFKDWQQSNRPQPPPQRLCHFDVTQRDASDRPDRWITLPTGNSFGWDEVKNLSIPLIQEKYMKFNLKHIAIAAAMVAASPAFAASNGPADGNGSLFLNVWQVSGSNGGTVSASYTLDLQKTFADFAANKGVDKYIDQVINDSYFSQMLSAATGSPSKLLFSVFGGDQGVSSPSNTLITTFTTANAKPSSGLELNGALDNIANFTGALQSTGSFVPDAGGNPTIGGASYNTAGAAYYGSGATLNTLVGNSSPNSGFVGSKLGVAQFTDAGSSIVKDIYQGTFFLGQQIPGGQYSLVYAVPEPEGYALALAGLCAIGFVSRRRKTS